MPSYTPQEHAETTVWDAMYAGRNTCNISQLYTYRVLTLFASGFASGGLAAIPTTAAVYAAMQFSPRFVKVSNLRVSSTTFHIFGFSLTQHVLSAHSLKRQQIGPVELLY